MLLVHVCAVYDPVDIREWERMPGDIVDAVQNWVSDKIADATVEKGGICLA